MDLKNVLKCNPDLKADIIYARPLDIFYIYDCGDKECKEKQLECTKYPECKIPIFHEVYISIDFKDIMDKTVTRILDNTYPYDADEDIVKLAAPCLEFDTEIKYENGEFRYIVYAVNTSNRRKKCIPTQDLFYIETESSDDEDYLSLSEEEMEVE